MSFRPEHEVRSGEIRARSARQKDIDRALRLDFSAALEMTGMGGRPTLYEPPFSKGRGRQFIGQRTPAVRGARGERAQKRARAVTENGAFLTPFEKDGLRQQVGGGGDLPLRDKVRLSESSISKTPAAYRWGQILPVYCAALSKPPPLAKGRLGVDRAIQPNFPMRRGAWGNLTELSAEYCRLILYTSN